jgi:hypothetical protein
VFDDLGRLLAVTHYDGVHPPPTHFPLERDEMADTDGQGLTLAKYALRTYTTFISRARAAERLNMRGVLWNIALATSSTATLAISVVSLASPKYLGGKADLVVCLFSIVTLVLSLIVALFNYGARSRDMFHSYRTIQRVSVEAERLAGADLSDADQQTHLARLDAEYQLGLDQSENHTTLDFFRARKIQAESTNPEEVKAKKDRTRASFMQDSLTVVPVAITIIAVGLLAWILLHL